MYQIIQTLHSYWAYLVLFMLIVATVNALVKYFSGKQYSAIDFRISLFALIVTHTQLLVGLILYFLSPWFVLWSQLGGGVMKDSVARLYLVEHPLVNIIAVVLITVGYSKHKKKLTSEAKFKLVGMFYAIALVLLLSRIPWSTWLA